MCSRPRPPERLQGQAGWRSRALFFKFVVSLLLGGLGLGLLSLFGRFEVVAQAAILVALFLLVLGFIALGWRKWRSRTRGWGASHFQMLGPGDWGQQLVMKVSGPDVVPLLDIVCVVVGPGNIVARAPKEGHVFHDRGTLKSKMQWRFPKEFGPDDLTQPLPRGLYRATWSAVEPDFFLRIKHTLLARDYFIVWPHGVFRGRVRE